MLVNYDEIWENKWGDMQKYGPYHRHRRRIIKKMLNGLKFETVLDVGCGEGSNLFFLKSLNRNLHLTGIDISQEAINLAKKILPETEFYVFDCQKDKLNQKFDLVLCIDVVEHMEDDDEAIKNMYSMTNKYCLIGSIQGKMREFERGVGHKRNYKYGELEEKMKKAGFKILETVEWGWPYYSPLYRNFLDFFGLNRLTEGKMGLLRRLISSLLYYLFIFNSSKKGDTIFVLAVKDDFY